LTFFVNVSPDDIVPGAAGHNEYRNELDGTLYLAI